MNTIPVYDKITKALRLEAFLSNVYQRNNKENAAFAQLSESFKMVYDNFDVVLSQLDALHSDFSENNKKLESLNNLVREKEQEIETKDKKIELLNFYLKEKQKEIKSLSSLIEARDKKVESKNSTLGEKDRKIRSLNVQIDQNKEQIKTLSDLVDCLIQEIEQLKSTNQTNSSSSRTIEATTAAIIRSEANINNNKSNEECADIEIEIKKERVEPTNSTQETSKQADTRQTSIINEDKRKTLNFPIVKNSNQRIIIIDGDQNYEMQARTANEENNQMSTESYINLVLHAYECEWIDCEVVGCKSMRKVLSHSTICTDPSKCQVAHCSSTRQIIDHWNSCTTSDCSICNDSTKQTIESEVLGVDSTLSTTVINNNNHEQIISNDFNNKQVDSNPNPILAQLFTHNMQRDTRFEQQAKRRKICDMIDTNGEYSILTLNVNQVHQNNTTTTTNNNNKQCLISQLTPVEKDEQSNEMIKDIVGFSSNTEFNDINDSSLVDLFNHTIAIQQQSFVSIPDEETTTVRSEMAPLFSNQTKRPSSVPILLESMQPLRKIIKLDEIEDNVKIPCLMETFNQFNYMYSIQKGKTDCSYFHKFCFVMIKGLIVGVKPMNSRQNLNQWLTDEKMESIERSLIKNLLL